MAARKSNIEFLPKEEWEKGTLGKFLKWALTVGRYIVILVELVVILAFLSRFKFDRDLTNLSEKTKQQQAIIQSSAQFEQKFRFLQKQISAIETLEKNRLETNKVLNELARLTPINVFLSDLSVSNKEISLTATALSEGGLASFIKNLKNSPLFEKITLSQVSSVGEKAIGINFQLKSEFKKNHET